MALLAGLTIVTPVVITLDRLHAFLCFETAQKGGHDFDRDSALALRAVISQKDSKVGGECVGACNHIRDRFLAHAAGVGVEVGEHDNPQL